MIVSKTLSTWTFDGTNPVRILWRTFSDVGGNTPITPTTIDRCGQLQARGAAALVFLKFIYATSDGEATNVNFDITMTAVATINRPIEFAIPPASIGISLFTITASVVAALSVGG